MRQETIVRAYEQAKAYDACVVGVPVKDTIRRVKAADTKAMDILDRDEIWQIQTPQGFYYGEILEAYRRLFADASRDNVMITDDAMVYERAFPEKKVKLIEAFYENIKITTAEDLEVAKARL